MFINNKYIINNYYNKMNNNCEIYLDHKLIQLEENKDLDPFLNIHKRTLRRLKIQTNIKKIKNFLSVLTMFAIIIIIILAGLKQLKN
jgi:hypothetical protein